MTVFSQQALKVRKMKQMTEQKQTLNKGQITDWTKVGTSIGRFALFHLRQQTAAQFWTMQNLRNSQDSSKI